jgi:hypothetical protein
MIGRRGLPALLFALGSVAASAQVPVGTEFRVDTLAHVVARNRASRDAAILPTGEFVVAWGASNVPGGDLYEVRARVFSASGVARGAEFTVNTITTGYQSDPAVSASDSGTFVMVWMSSAPPNFTHIDGRRFDLSGNTVGAEFRVDSIPGTQNFSPSVAMAPTGEFVVVWMGSDGSDWNIVGRLYAADGAPIGGQFVVNSSTAFAQGKPSVEMDGVGNFVVAWDSYESPVVVKARMFTAAGAPVGPDLVVGAMANFAPAQSRVARSRDGSFMVVWHSGNDRISGRRYDPSGVPAPQFDVAFTNLATQPTVAASADGDFVVSWQAVDDDWVGPFARRFEASGASGPPIRANTFTTGLQSMVSVASDTAGNFIVTWRSSSAGPTAEMRAQRFAGGLSPAALAVDAAPGPASDGNRVLEAGETVAVEPAWLNAGLSAATFTGSVASFAGPGTPGNPTYTVADAAADYGTAAAGATASCTAGGDCYALAVGVPTARPAVHWDARFREDIAPASLGAARNWDLHVGDSFADVPRTSPFYRDVETLLHHSVTGGCTASAYCPAASTTREQMAVFVLVAKEGASYLPPPCAPPNTFADVPETSPFCRWVEELARRGVVSGCGGGNYCPSSSVSRDQMAVFVLRALDPALNPPACAPPNTFADVPETSPFCRWIEELANRQIVGGCGGGNYCPTDPVTREQMGVFLTGTFALQLYGP